MNRQCFGDRNACSSQSPLFCYNESKLNQVASSSSKSFKSGLCLPEYVYVVLVVAGALESCARLRLRIDLDSKHTCVGL